MRDFRIARCLSVVLLLFSTGGALSRAQVDAPVNTGFDIPLLINPAQCGLTEEEYDPLFAYSNPKERMSNAVQLNYKNQVSGAFSRYSMRIVSAAYQARFFQKRMALGLHLYSNTLNASALSDFSAFVTYAYHWDMVLDEFGAPLHRLSFGLQAGYRHWGYNSGNMLTGSMYDPSYIGGYNPSLRPDDAELPDNKNMFDGNFGLQYTGVFSSKVRLNIGGSLYHIFRPKTGIFSPDYRVPMRWVAYTDLFVAVSPGFMEVGRGSQLGFSFMYNYQRPESSHDKASTFEGGINYYYLFKKNLSVGCGLLYRTEMTFVPQVMIDVDRFTLRLQMEFNVNYSYNNLMAIGLGYRW